MWPKAAVRAQPRKGSSFPAAAARAFRFGGPASQTRLRLRAGGRSAGPPAAPRSAAGVTWCAGSRPASFPAGRSGPPELRRAAGVSVREGRASRRPGGPGRGRRPAECLAGPTGIKWLQGTPFHPLPSPGSVSGEGPESLLGEGRLGRSRGAGGPVRRPRVESERAQPGGEAERWAGSAPARTGRPGGARGRFGNVQASRGSLPAGPSPDR